MKYLLVLGIVLIAVYVWRANRRAERHPPPAPPADAAATLDMVRCPVCSVHLPSSDAVAGQRGRYCSADHRQQVEG